MLRSRSTRLAGGLVALTLLLSACGDDDDPAPDPTSQDDGSEADGTQTDGTEGTDDVATEVPDDLCALMPAEAVGTVLGEEVEAKTTPSGGCQFAGGTAASLYPTIELTPADGPVTLPEARDAAESVLGAPSEVITAAGQEGFVVHGTLAGSQSTQGAIAVDGLLITLTMSGGDPAANTDIVVQLLELTADALG